MRNNAGRQAVIQQFLSDGLSFMFGNPGTVEQGFLDSLSDYPAMRYILTLQESVAVMIADGYARASRRPALVQIHSAPGLGNAIGALYQAKRGHAPLVVIGADAGIRYQPMDGQMACDLVGMAEPVTKWATMVMDSASVLRVLRRAVKIAATPPMGPVYVCLPMDVLDEPCVEKVMPTVVPSTRVTPDADFTAQAAAWLAAAKRPAILMGDGVAWSGAHDELARVAERVGAEVWGCDAGELNLRYDHPLYCGQTGHMCGADSLPILRRGDVVLVCGTYIVPEVFSELGPVFARGAKVIHVDLNAYEIAKNHPVDLAAVADPKRSLAALARALDRTMSAAQKRSAQRRSRAIAAAKAAKIAAAKAADRRTGDAVPMQPARFMEELAARLPDDAMVFDEALTCWPALARHIPPTLPGHFFQVRGGSLGVGIPGAIGAKLARPDKTVVGFTGDGAAMYTIQALWTAARYGVEAKFVVCNNGTYKLLQDNIAQYWSERGIRGRSCPIGFDLSWPPLRFDRIAESMSVSGVRVERPEQIGPAIDRMLSHKGPFLLDLVLAGDSRPELIRPRGVK